MRTTGDRRWRCAGRGSGDVCRVLSGRRAAGRRGSPASLHTCWSRSPAKNAPGSKQPHSHVQAPEGMRLRDCGDSVGKSAGPRCWAGPARIPGASTAKTDAWRGVLWATARQPPAAGLLSRGPRSDRRQTPDRTTASGGAPAVGQSADGAVGCWPEAALSRPLLTGDRLSFIGDVRRARSGVRRQFPGAEGHLGDGDT